MNLLMKRIGANITLPLMVTLWGVVTACQGIFLVSDLHQLNELMVIFRRCQDLRRASRMPILPRSPRR